MLCLPLGSFSMIFILSYIIHSTKKTIEASKRCTDKKKYKKKKYYSFSYVKRVFFSVSICPEEQENLWGMILTILVFIIFFFSVKKGFFTEVFSTGLV